MEMQKVDWEEVWKQVQALLQNMMPRSIFDAHLMKSRGYWDEGLVVEVHLEVSRVWIEKSLHRLITRAMRSLFPDLMDFGIEVICVSEVFEIEKCVLVSGENSQDYTQVVRPGFIFAGSQYFRLIWMPILTPNRWALILHLRQLCFANYGDWTVSTLKRLGSAIGVSEKTAWRLLQPSEVVDLFILSRETVNRYLPDKGMWVVAATKWVVNLDEPILNLDMAKRYDKCIDRSALEQFHPEFSDCEDCEDSASSNGQKVCR